MQKTQERRVRSLSQEDLLEKEMSTHSSILAWEISRTEGPGRLPSMGSQKVRFDLVTKQRNKRINIYGNVVDTVVAQFYLIY